MPQTGRLSVVDLGQLALAQVAHHRPLRRGTSLVNQLKNADVVIRETSSFAAAATVKVRLCS
jgi:hypothetical protein